MVLGECRKEPRPRVEEGKQAAGVVVITAKIHHPGFGVRGGEGEGGGGAEAEEGGSGGGGEEGNGN